MRKLTIFTFVLFGMLSPPVFSEQTCNVQILSTTPTADFQLNGDGTVTHKPTGLMWKRCREGQSGDSCTIGTAKLYYWKGALQLAEESNFASYTDWRLPNVKELASIVELSCHTPSLNITVFPGDSGSITWSNSPVISPSSMAWAMYFSNGSANAVSRSSARIVRLVRSAN